MGSCEIEEELGLQSLSPPPPPPPPPPESLVEEYGNLRLEVKIEEGKGMREEDDANLEKCASTLKEEQGECFQDPERLDENTGWKEDDADLAVSEGKFEGGGHIGNMGLGDDTDRENHSASFKEEKSEGVHCAQRVDENRGWEDDSDLVMSEEKSDGGGHNENMGLEDDADPEKHSASFKDEKREGSHYPQRPDENTGWKDGAGLAMSEGKFEGGGHNENKGLEDDSDPEKHSATFKEEKSEGSHYPQRPDENTARKDGAGLAMSEVKFEGGGHNENMGLEDDADQEKHSASFKEEKSEGFHYFQRPDENTGWKDGAGLAMSEGKFEGGGHNENKGLEDDADQEKHSASFKEEKSEGFHYPPSTDENTVWEVDADLNKYEGGGDHEKTGWEEDDTDLAKGSTCFKEEEKGEWVHYPPRPDEGTGWEDDGNVGKMEERFEVGGDNEKTGWEEDDADLAKGSACFEVKGGWVHYPPRPDESTGWNDDRNVGKVEERFEVGGDNGYKRWEDDASLQKGQWFEYPQRPSEPDCTFYMRTGNCRYGSNCKFNHPPDRKRNQARSWNTLGPVQAAGETAKEVPERLGQKRCKFFLMPGGCKFGSTCKYGLHGHVYEKAEIGLVELNFSGLPLRPGERECPYYMRTGSCKFSSNCRFHHPDPTFGAERDPPSGYGKGGSPKQLASGASQLPEEFQSSQPFQGNSNEPVSFSNASHGFFSAMLFPPKGLHPTSDRNSYQVPVDPMSSYERNINYPSASASNGPTPNADGPMHQPAQMEEYPERPGVPECPYFMRYRNCKFGSACRFRHPSSSTLNGPTPMADAFLHQQAQMNEFPHRPGEPVCPYFVKNRNCKFKSTCKFHHPLILTLNGPTTKAADGPMCQPAQMEEYPQRHGEPECPYFMRYGNCKFGSSCKFHHPSAPTLNGPTRRVDGPVHHEEWMEEYPERPGEPECTFFVKFGHCKFKSTCKFHHPKIHLPREPSCIISPLGLPLRPDQTICSYYSRFGICKFGPSCRFDHPVDHGSSASEAARSPNRVSSPDETRTEEDKTADSNALEQEAEW